MRLALVFPSVIAVGLSVLLAGCGEGEDPTGTTTTTTTVEPIRDDPCSQLPGGGATAITDSTQVALGNGYVCAVVDLASQRVSVLKGDYFGQAGYGKNVLSPLGIALEREDGDGTIHRHSASDAITASVDLDSGNDNIVIANISFITDVPDSNASVTETWSLQLRNGSRSLSFSTSGRVTRNVAARALRHTFAMEPSSIYGLFDRGVVQMKGASAEKSFYATTDSISRLYALGGGGGEGHEAGNMSLAFRWPEASKSVVLRSSASGGDGGYSGVEEVLAGGLPEEHAWSAGWGSVQAVTIAAGTAWQTSVDLAPNRFDFPVHGPFGDLETGEQIDAVNLQAMLTGIYGSPVGQLCTHDGCVVSGERVAQMATTIARPTYGYQGNYNFFDPDNYISTAALLFSGDPYLQEQVRTVLERNGDFINEKGQLPHHFQNATPTYQALSGETQTGPNVFWILSCFNYAKTTGDLEWLSSYMPKLRNASAFLFDMIDPNFNLLDAPGSLMIDVFIRNNFTTDTNAMAVGFLREFALAEAAVGNMSGYEMLEGIADKVTAATDAMLWNNETDDHYVTQLNPDGTTRDFVDYDANLIALAYGIAPADRATKVFQRVDGGRCTHGRATFVSERYYGKNDTTQGNIGDSWCSMGRIGWFDALARQRYGDQQTFDDLLLDPLIGDVIRWTWLHERYQCNGSPELNRTSHYFEYPAVTAMMIRFVRYGIRLGLQEVTIAPFGPSEFSYAVGNVRVVYNNRPRDAEHNTVALLQLPGTGSKKIYIEGLEPSRAYNFAVSGCASQEEPGTVRATESGKINFTSSVGDSNGPCTVAVTVGAVVSV